MLRSFSYAAYSGLFTFTARRPEDYGRLESWATFWEKWISAAFLRSYRETTAGAPFLPNSAENFQRLLEVFLMDKVLDELNSELDNRSGRLRIPLQGVLELAR
jgi:maltose alpha-D-glucosyltransferase/alpha-amylase